MQQHQQYDLHAHTTASDGALTPRELVRLAASEGLGALAITDHDTVDGVDDALDETASLGLALEIVPGVEVSASFGDVPVHVLGLFVEHREPWLRRFFAEASERRVERVRQIVRKLSRVGVNVEADAVLARSKHGTVGRPHVAELLVDLGLVGTIGEAFDRYLGQDGPAYVGYEKVSLDDALSVIRRAGGVASLAHPLLLRNDELIPQMARRELDALEVFHRDHSQEQAAAYGRMANELGLLTTGGSDFHRANGPNQAPQLGCPALTKDAFEELRTLALSRSRGA